MRKGEGARRSKGRGHPIVGGDGSEVPGVKVVQLANEKINVVRGEGVVFLQIIKRDEGEGSWKIPPKDVNGGAGVLRRLNDVHHRGVKGKGRGDMNLNDDQGIVVDF